MYDTVVKGGRLIDPSQGIHEYMDVALSEGKVADVRKGINAAQARHVVNASGRIVTPGLIDIHTHCCHNIAYIGVDPELACLAKGSTTVLDAGSLGELLFTGFKKYIISVSKTRIYAMLNIESLGMVEYSRTQKWPELIENRDDMFINIIDTVKMIKENKNIILGVKWAHHDVRGLNLARKAADEAGCLLMAENHYQPETLKCMKEGDIVTHIFHGLKARPHDGLLDEDGIVQPSFFDAVKHGVILDVGHGRASFQWNIAEEAFKQGIRPDTISTDLHSLNINGPVYDMPTTMSKFLLLGMSLDEVVRASTERPAEVLGKQSEVGTLRPGARADLVVFKLREGKFVFTDVTGEERIGRQRLTPTEVIFDSRSEFAS